jgi:proteic killer suppression protein
MVATPRVSSLVCRNLLGYIYLGDPQLQAQGTGEVLFNWKQGRYPSPARRALRVILGRLNVSITPKDMNLPGLDLHPLTGDRKGTWAVKVSGNWRITFAFVGKEADAVDYEDYH